MSDVPPYLWNNIKPWVIEQGKSTYTPTPPPRFGSPRSVWGCLGFFFPVPENKSIQTIHSYIPPCQTHSETQWDEEEPSLGKVLVAFNTPATDTLRDRTPVITTTQSVFHRGNPTALATGTWWAIFTAGSWSADWKPNSTFFRKAWPCLNPRADQW